MYSLYSRHTGAAIQKISDYVRTNYTSVISVSVSKQTRSALFCYITQRLAVSAYRRLGTAHRSDLQGQKILDSGSLKIEPIGCPETSAMIYH